MNHQQHHTKWYYVKRVYDIAIEIFAWTMVAVLLYFFYVDIIKTKEKKTNVAELLQKEISIEINSTYKFRLTDGVAPKEIKNVGFTYYSRGDGFTPGSTTRSGRFVNDAVIAVSQPMWQKEVWPGDLIWVKATGKWYRVEDTMNAKYKDIRVDVYTHDMELANSGSSKTDIIIVRMPR